MLEHQDLGRFLALHARATRGCAIPSRPVADLLHVSEGGMLAREFWHLGRAVKIAAYAGDADIAVVEIVDRLTLALHEGRLAPLTAEEPWLAAIHWAMEDIERRPPTGGLTDLRENSVGQACKRLRERGFAVEVSGFGCVVSEQTRSRLGKRLDVLAASLGGVDMLHQLFRVLRDSNRLHDGFWLFGNEVVPPSRSKSPTLPYAWLLALGLKHLGRSRTTRQPAATWGELAHLLIDAAACFDVERYGQFDQIQLHPTDIFFLFDEAMGWAHLFAHPQAPPMMPGRLHSALLKLLTQEDLGALGPQFSQALSELEAAVTQSEPDRPNFLDRRSASRSYPTLMAEAFGRHGAVNRGLTNPLDPDAIDHFPVVLFEAPLGHVMLLPKTLTAAAAATWVVHRLWRPLDKKRADKLVGDLFETMIADACSGRGDQLIPDHHYRHGGKSLQIDVALRRGRDLALFETKAKSLTQAARSGDILRSLDDYTKSYLALLTQLARHEKAILDGATGLWTTDEAAGFDIVKIAISPLSYGPLSDRALARPLVSALARTEFDARTRARPDWKVLGALQRAVGRAMDEIRPIATDMNGDIDLFTYLIGVFWLDIGELLYLLDRAESVHGALRPLRRITFASRDVWTEIATVDRSGLGAGHWRPVG